MFRGWIDDSVLPCTNRGRYGSGLGSSSAAITSGLLAGLVLTGTKLKCIGAEELLQIAATVEGGLFAIAMTATARKIDLNCDYCTCTLTHTRGGLCLCRACGQSGTVHLRRDPGGCADRQSVGDTGCPDAERASVCHLYAVDPNVDGRSSVAPP